MSRPPGIHAQELITQPRLYDNIHRRNCLSNIRIDVWDNSRFSGSLGRGTWRYRKVSNGNWTVWLKIPRSLIGDIRSWYRHVRHLKPSSGRIQDFLGILSTSDDFQMLSYYSKSLTFERAILLAGIDCLIRWNRRRQIFRVTPKTCSWDFETCI